MPQQEQQELSLVNPVEEANIQQRVASNPYYSVFVSASAGSGKTKLLVDRLLRLMMPVIDDKGKIHPGTPPQKIQCLTYSKAAAAEMAIRLQRKLSEWVGLSDKELDHALNDLEIKSNPVMRKAARALFAEILDLPGGMRIETNHAFCQSILQRFPLEAMIIPQFKIIEEGDNLLTFKRAFEEKIDDIAVQDIQTLSPLVNNDNFLQILQELQQNQQHLQPVLQLIERNQFAPYLQKLLQLPYISKEEYLTEICQHWFEEDHLRACIEHNKSLKNKSIQTLIAKLTAWLDLSFEQRILQWDFWRSCFLTQKQDPRVFKVNKGDNDTILTDLNKQAAYVIEACQLLNKYDVYHYTLALLNVFTLIWQHYQEIKRTQGVLYYSDLINYTLQLLDDPGTAWVLFKLDGGLDHILLDEVQDNSTEQWRIAANLSNEFFAGLGRDHHNARTRTFFAVGDYKQSIYSFQGAKPKEFFRWKERLGQQVRDAGELWEDPQLRVSFRSSQIILDFVDQVFSTEANLPGVWDYSSLDQSRIHRSAKIDAPGRIDLWPLVTIEKNQDEDLETLWKPLKVNQQHITSDLVLAEYLANWIKKQIGQIPPYGGDPIKAGDILILIRKRSDFSRALIRALKSKNLPLANLVKTQLLDQIAVQDLLVLCEVLLLPQDDLILACVLKSPLGGLSEDSLMELAASRSQGQTLWDALLTRHEEREDWKTVWLMLSHLFARVDYVSPYALLVEILGEYRGRAKLLARLGGEAVEAIDELLAQALRYEDSHIPSLQGFLYWLKQSERTIKNEAESNLDMIRIMTVHGAKGLQGRVVILPDTMNLAAKQGGFQSDNVLIWKEDPQKNIQIPLYIPNNKFKIQESDYYKKEKLRLEKEESNRLLYVALTRASEWLLICGWRKNQEGNKSTAHKDEDQSRQTWYEDCDRAIRQLPNIQFCDFKEQWDGRHYFAEKKGKLTTQKEYKIDDSIEQKRKEKIKLPQWLGQKNDWLAEVLPAEEPAARQYIPSRPEGIIFGNVPEMISPAKVKEKKDPFFRGRVIHTLLQYLPDYPHHQRYEVASKWFQQKGSIFSSQEKEKIIHQVLQTIESPELRLLFDAESLIEQPITGIVKDVVITGQIDRMRILPDQIWLCDFKSGYKIPKRPETISKTYLRQMSAYWVLLKQIYPKHSIKPLLIWTENLTIMQLSDDLLERYLPA